MGPRKVEVLLFCTPAEWYVMCWGFDKLYWKDADCLAGCASSGVAASSDLHAFPVLSY
ncbi:hypothetical protein SLEP1_g26566 [Rubroshorea leprosula]|uniref:Uncharacterized protein n=1 Tax=Rubroshorea leprosula TaxID=152421 RepID=A0AAV5JWR9_9ROSI|nr:hypothetical protein SLEP1_g26566 [Rubroshorea leprosula]